VEIAMAKNDAAIVNSVDLAHAMKAALDGSGLV